MNIKYERQLKVFQSLTSPAFTEAGVELLTAGIGTGTGRIVNAIASRSAKETAKTVSKTGAKTVFKNIAVDFASEAFEEGLSEVLAPVYQRTPSTISSRTPPTERSGRWERPSAFPTGTRRRLTT